MYTLNPPSTTGSASEKEVERRRIGIKNIFLWMDYGQFWVTCSVELPHFFKSETGVKSNWYVLLNFLCPLCLHKVLDNPVSEDQYLTPCQPLHDMRSTFTNIISFQSLLKMYLVSHWSFNFLPFKMFNRDLNKG